MTLWSLETFWQAQGWGLALLVLLSFFPSLFHLEEYLFLAFLIGSLVARWKSGRVLWISTPIDWPIGCLLIWILISVPFALDPAYSFAEWRKLLVQVLVFYWAVHVISQQLYDKMAPQIFGAVVLGTVLLSCAALGDFVLRGGTWRDRLVRAGAPSSDYNWLTTYMIIAIPVLLAVAYSARARLIRMLSLVATALALLAQTASYTRAGWLGMIAQGLTLGILTGRRVLILWVLLGSVFLAGGLVAVSQIGYQRDTVDPWTFGARISVWKLAASEIIEHPIVGVGYGNNTFMKRFAGYPGTDKAAHYHNTFLMMAMGSGLPALGFFIWMFVAIFRTVVSGAQAATDRQRYAFLVAVAVVVVGFATRNFFDYMFAGSLAFLFWILIATAMPLTFEGAHVSS